MRERFAARIRQEMTVRERNQSDLAREASKHLRADDVSRDNVSTYVNQKALPGPITLGALAKALDTTPEGLLPERGAPVVRGESIMLPMTDVRDAGGIGTQSEAEANSEGAKKYYKS